MKNRRIVVAAVVAATCLVSTPAAAAPGTEDPIAERARRAGAADLAPKKLNPSPGLSLAAAALMATQEKLDAVAGRIEKSAASGLGGIVVDAKTNTLDVYWHGAQTKALDKEITAARAGGMTVRVTPAKYTRKALRAETARLAGEHLSAAGGAIRSIEAKADGSGLLVGVAAADGQSLTAAAPAVASDLPVEFTAATPDAADRWYDSDPYWGGALLLGYASSSTSWENYGPACTSGFGVTGLNGANTYMMFADHCGQFNWRTGMVTTSDGTVYQNQLGNSLVRDAAHDTQLILTPAGSGGGVYTGESWLGSGQSGRSVKGSAASNVGDYICTEGSYSGTVCDIRVVGVGATITIGGYGVVRDMVRANHIYYRGAAGNGDSGGPVIAVTTGGVIARGTISAINGNTVVDCFGVAGVPADQEGRHCAWEMYYPDIRFQLSGVGVRINTQ